MPPSVTTPENIRERFWSKVQKTNYCWNWMGSHRTAGYGVMHIRPRQPSVSRLSYEFAKGPIPDGFEIDHLCRNTRCVNPDHLEAVTHSVNVKRGNAWHHWVEKAKNRTHCERGHLYRPKDVSPYNGYRWCQSCRKIRIAKGAK